MGGNQYKHNGAPALTRPIITIRNAGIRVAGRAFYHRHEIEINSNFLNSFPEHVINQTAPHELAHRISVMLYGLDRGHGHGAPWQNVMRSLGLAPKRLHDMSLESVNNPGVSVSAAKVYNYTCICNTPHPFSQLRHNNVVLRGMTYTCRNCHSTCKRSS